MVDCDPSESIANLGSTSVDNVSSGWQSTTSSHKEWNIYIIFFEILTYVDMHVFKHFT